MDYITEAQRTKSDQYHLDNLGPEFLISALASTQMSTSLADKVKKALFYGKEPLWDAAQIAFVEDQKGLADHVKKDAVPVDVVHSVLGIITEGGELAEAVAKAFFTGDLDEVNLDEEMGDILWYIAMFCHHRDIDFDSLMERNINKLRTRFPDKFTQEKAINRDLEAEREQLER